MVNFNKILNGSAYEIVIGPAPANILSCEVIEKIDHFLTGVLCDNDIKLILFRGEGKHFGFGASVEEHTREKVFDMLPRFNKFIGKILNFPIPTLAKVTGVCLGGSFELAMACKFIFAGQKAKFAVPEATLAVFPPPASIILPTKISETLAQELIITGRNAKVEEISQMLTAVCPEDELDSTIDSFFSDHLNKKSASSIRMTTQASGTIMAAAYKQHIKSLEGVYLNQLMETHDACEGINAFIEKRDPVFKNQ